MTYYNTNNESGSDLVAAIKQNASQEEIVLGIFIEQGRPLTYVEVHELFGVTKAPEQSIKRAITNLKKEGYLFKSDEMALGRWGRKCHKYELSDK
jgi:hypothetical protein